jgi:hypothetical protein
LSESLAAFDPAAVLDAAGRGWAGHHGFKAKRCHDQTPSKLRIAGLFEDRSRRQYASWSFLTVFARQKLCEAKLVSTQIKLRQGEAQVNRVIQIAGI